MNRARTWFRWLTVLCGVAFLAACGGGGGSSSGISSSGTPQTSGTTITAVDPYIVGAVFQEIDSNGKVIQTSQPSDQNGKAVFGEKVSAGNTIVMITPGMHGGKLYQGQLKRKVESAGTEFIVSPLTTLAAELGSVADAVTTLQNAGFNISADDFDVDPIEQLKGKTPKNLTSSDLDLVVANLAVNAALQKNGTNPAPGDIATIKDNLLTDADGNGNPDILDSAQNVTSNAVDAVAIAETLTAVNDAMVEGIITAPSDVAFDTILTEAAKGETPPVIESDGQGGTTITSGSTTVKSKLDKAYNALLDLEQTSTTTGTLPADKLKQAAGLFLEARALVSVDTTATRQQKDEARFFGAFASLAQLADPISDQLDNGLNNLGDILDAFGLDSSDAARGDLKMLPIETCTDVTTDFGYVYTDCNLNTVASTSPRSGELVQTTAEWLLGRLQQIADDMDQISPDFFMLRNDPLVALGQTEYTYKDVLFVKGFALAMKAQLELTRAYNLDVNLYDVQSKDIPYTPYTLEAFLADYPDFAKLQAQQYLADAKADVAAAIDAFTAALNQEKAELDHGEDPTDDFISVVEESCQWDVMGPTCGYDKALTLATIDEIKGQLQTAKTSLDAPATFGVSNPVTFDFSKLFAGLDLRSMAPDYAGDMPGMLPDPTFAGLLPDTTQINLNQDLDGDGHPDLLYRHYTNFFDGFLDGSVYGCTNMILTGWSSDINWDLTFDTANHSFTFGWSNYLGSGTETGFYEIQQDGSLLLTNDNQNSTVFEKIEIKIHPEWGPKTYAPQYGIEATLTKTANLSQTVETVWIEYGPYLGTP